MPARIAKLATDARGYPILAAVRTPDGGYNFRGLNLITLAGLIRRRCCMICGDPLPYYKAWIGGPTSKSNRIYSEPPMHEDCLRYAFGVCPWLLSGGWSRDHRPEHLDYLRMNPDGRDYMEGEWIITISRDFEMRRGARGMPLFKTSPILDWRVVHPGEIDLIPPMTTNDGLTRTTLKQKSKTA